MIKNRLFDMFKEIISICKFQTNTKQKIEINFFLISEKFHINDAKIWLFDNSLCI